MPGWARWLLAPLHALALAGGAKSFEANPLLGSPWLNRRGLHLARKRLAQRLGARRRAALADALSLQERTAFDRDGYLVIPDFLPRRIRRAAGRNPRHPHPGAGIRRWLDPDPADPAGCRHPARPAGHRAALLGPRYQGLHAYAGSFRQAPHLFVQSVFSGVRDAPPDVQSHWHTDTFFPTVKSWLFLGDVAPGEAGFSYVPGSHRPTRRHLAWERRQSITAARSADAMTREGSLRVEPAALARLGYPAPRKLAVAANTLVIADTSGLHRRGLARGRPAASPSGPMAAAALSGPGRGARCRGAAMRSAPSGRRRTCWGA